VWNSSGYESVETLAALDGIADVFMPDFKSASTEACAAWMDAPDYPEVATAAVREMRRQVGDLAVDTDGVARRGLLVRHLVMPGRTDDAVAVMRILADVSPGCAVNVMDQYRPLGSAPGMPGIDRRPDPAEVAAAKAAARAAGLRVL
jgi:putative pyruvate formate lyase activating enzyme